MVGEFMSVILLSILSSCAQASKIVYVNGSVATDGDGLSWATAKKTVTNGLAASVSGDEVWVARGRTLKALPSYTALGYMAGLLGRRLRATRGTGRQTLLSLTATKGLGWRGVPAGATTATIIDGFTIRNACVGVSCSSASPAISNDTFAGSILGGVTVAGIVCSNSSPVISNNVIRGYTVVRYGGGIYCSGTSSPIITNNTIVGNVGNGITCSTAPIAISNNIVLRDSRD